MKPEINPSTGWILPHRPSVGQTRSARFLCHSRTGKHSEGHHLNNQTAQRHLLQQCYVSESTKEHIALVESDYDIIDEDVACVLFDPIFVLFLLG